MKKQEKAELIRQKLEELYPSPAIPLDHTDPFTLLVSVILSAQTTDKKVNEVTPRLFERANTPEKLSELSVEEIREIIREIGLAPQKAKSLKEMSRLLVERHGSKVPDDFDSLVSLPGVGRKTANVVIAQAFGRPAFPVDTHIHRLANRWGLSDEDSPDKVEADLRAIFPEDCWSKLHLQIIYFGREHCPARGHDLSTCPICSFAATKKRILEESPKPKTGTKEKR
ncbi:MAG: endonuclease III [Deltaproteobacteria bacterium]|nr:endonuclease III [Deltaproteobacteria bacterium]